MGDGFSIVILPSPLDLIIIVVFLMIDSNISPRKGCFYPILAMKLFSLNGSILASGLKAAII